MSNKIRRKKGFFSISAVAKMFSIHQQTIRMYEKEGLIQPKRSSGNTRLFSEEDINRLEEIIHLTHILGINLAGVEMILKLKRQMQNMQKDMNKLFEKTQEELTKDAEHSKLIIKSSVQQLANLKKQKGNEHGAEASTSEATPQSKPSEPDILDADTWEIDYDNE